MIVFDKNGYYYCTNCNSEFDLDYNYCPWCGTAKEQKTLKDFMKPNDDTLVQNITECAKEEGGFNFPSDCMRLAVEITMKRMGNDKVQCEKDNG